ncbi:hypothetical protein ACHAXH_005792 [Discostella pseudostelligera]
MTAAAMQNTSTGTSTTSTSRMKTSAEQNKQPPQPQYSHDVNDDSVDESYFDFRPFPEDTSCLSVSVSFDNNFEQSIQSMEPFKFRSAAPQEKGDDIMTKNKISLTASTLLDVSSDVEEEEDTPAEVSAESNSVCSDGSSGSNRIEFIQLEENDESLVEITLDCRAMEEELASEIFVHLRSNTHLKLLRLKCAATRNGNSNDDRQQKALCKIVSALKFNDSIERLEINGAITINREVASSLAPALAYNPSMQVIRMNKVKFVGASLSILFVAMQHMKQIRQLSFHHCDWEEHNAETIASSLPYLNLHSLALVGMNIASEAWPYLFQNILQSKNLVQLDLSRNHLEEDNLRALIKSITTSRNPIKTLFLSACGLTYPCAKELSMGLREYNSLTSLDISHNPNLTDKSAIYFKDLIKCNRSITKFVCHDCNMSQYSVNAIDSGLRYNNSILKSFLSETATMAIFEVVDIIGKFDMLEAVPSFGGANFAPLIEEKKEESASRPKKQSGNNKSRSNTVGLVKQGERRTQ